MDTNTIATNTPTTPAVLVNSGRRLGSLAIKATIKDTQARCFQILTETSDNLIQVDVSSGRSKDPYGHISMNGRIKEEAYTAIRELYTRQLADRDEINHIIDLTFSIELAYNTLYASYNIVPTSSYEINGTTDLRNKIKPDKVAGTITSDRCRHLGQSLNKGIESLHDYFRGIERRLNERANAINTSNPFQIKRQRLQLLKAAADTEVLTMKTMRTELQNIIRNEYEQICKAAKPEERNEELGPTPIL